LEELQEGPSLAVRLTTALVFLLSHLRRHFSYGFSRAFFPSMFPPCTLPPSQIRTFTLVRRPVCRVCSSTSSWVFSGLLRSKFPPDFLNRLSSLDSGRRRHAAFSLNAPSFLSLSLRCLPPGTPMYSQFIFLPPHNIPSDEDPLSVLDRCIGLLLVQSPRYPPFLHYSYQSAPS